jgi:hypothetical protein
LDAKFKKVILIEERIFSKKNIIAGIHAVNICCLLVSKNIADIKIEFDHDKYLSHK